MEVGKKGSVMFERKKKIWCEKRGERGIEGVFCVRCESRVSKIENRKKSCTCIYIYISSYMIRIYDTSINYEFN